MALRLLAERACIVQQVGKRRMTSTPIGFRLPCWTSLSSAASPTTPLRLASVPAGAFHTPREASMRAYRPVRYPDGGSRIGSADAPVGSSALTHGKYSAPYELAVVSLLRKVAASSGVSSSAAVSPT